MEINETYVKLSGRVPFPLSLELGQDVTVTIESTPYFYNVVKSEDFDNQDNTIDRVFTLKSISE